LPKLGLRGPFQGADCDEHGNDPKQWNEFAEHRRHDFLTTVMAQPIPSAGTLCVSNELLAKRVSQVSLQCRQGPPQFWAFCKANSLADLLGDFDKVHRFRNFYRPITWTLRPTC
jgi:hypothetical protein